jgi:hypothetical protein
VGKEGGVDPHQEDGQSSKQVASRLSRLLVCGLSQGDRQHSDLNHGNLVPSTEVLGCHGPDLAVKGYSKGLPGLGGGPGVGESGRPSPPSAVFQP